MNEEGNGELFIDFDYDYIEYCNIEVSNIVIIVWIWKYDIILKFCEIKILFMCICILKFYMYLCVVIYFIVLYILKYLKKVIIDYFIWLNIFLIDRGRGG